MNASRSGVLILILCLLWSTIATAGEWKRSADLGLALTQSYFNDAWTGGEAGVLVWVSNANLHRAKQLGVKTNWTDALKLSLGQTRIQDNQTRKWAKPEKSFDRISLESITPLTVDGGVDPYRPSPLRASSRTLAVKRRLDSVRLVESAGITRVFTETEQIGPASGLGLALRRGLDNTVVSIAPDQKEGAINRGRWAGVGHGLESYLLPRANEQAPQAVPLSGLLQFGGIAILAWEDALSAAVSKHIQLCLSMESSSDNKIDTPGRFPQTLALGLTSKML